MQIHGDLDFLTTNTLQNVGMEVEAGFPVTAQVGRMIMVDQTLYICIALNGADPVWYPLTNKINTYVHDQAATSTTWNVVHDLNTTTPVIQVNNNGVVVIPDDISIVDENNLTVTFSTAISGTVTVMYGNRITPNGVGIVNPPVAGDGGFTTITQVFGKHVGWRVIIDAAISGSTSVEVQEVELFSTGSTLETGGTAFAADNLGANYTAAGAFDANKVSRNPGSWASATGTAVGNYIGQLYSTAVAITDFSLTSNLANPLADLADFRLQYSDDTTNGTDGIWVDVITVTSEPSWTAGETRNFLTPAVTFDPTVVPGFVTLSNGNLTAVNSSISQFRTVSSTTAHSTGQIYVEVTLDAMANNVGFGLSTDPNGVNTISLDNANPGLGWFKNGHIEVDSGGGAIDPAATFAQGDVLGMAIDFGSGAVQFFVDGGQVSATTLTTLGVPYYVGVSMAGATVTVNYGATAFTKTDVPAGFDTWTV